MVQPLPNYKNLDLSGEAQLAALRMEARAREAASDGLFAQLVAPLLTPNVRNVLEVGCGTAALTRRIGQHHANASLYATDKSAGMVQAAQSLIQTEQIQNVQLAVWDVLNPAAFPFAQQPFDLIISSVMIPYLADGQIATLVQQMAARLSPNGVLAFVEQDLHTDSLHFPDFTLTRAILSKHLRDIRPGWSLGLRPLLRQAGLTLLPRRSYLWVDERYGAYTQDLLGRMADAALAQDAITAAQRDDWLEGLAALANAGDFYYGLVYHLVAGHSSAQNGAAA